VVGHAQPHPCQHRLRRLCHRGDLTAPGCGLRCPSGRPVPAAPLARQEDFTRGRVPPTLARG
jgi:hypothetical protein